MEKNLYVDGKRGWGRPKKRWENVMVNDIKKVEISEEDAGNRVKWKCKVTRVADPK